VYALTRLSVKLTVFAMKKNNVSLEGVAATSSTQTILLERLEGLTLLAPDIAMLGYLRGPRLGAITYNLAHLKILPLTLGSIGLLTGNTLEIQLALIWFAHIGMDRAAGYGLKLETGFSDTTLGKIGRQTTQKPMQPAH
jgi:hypothetical protein